MLPVVLLLAIPFVDLPAQSPPLRFLREIDLSTVIHQPKSRLVDLSLNQQQEIYLLDGGLHRVLLLDSTGALLREIGGFGWETYQFDQPQDIWAENSLDVFVADYNNNRVQRFDRRLNFVGTYTSEAVQRPELQFGLPVAVTFSRFGELFLIDSENRRVLRFNADGEPEQSFGDWDWGEGRLEEPVDICIDARDQVLISDAEQSCIFRYDYYGNYLQTITHPELRRPGRMATAENLLFVLDSRSGRGFVFDAVGAYLGPLPVAGAPDGAESVRSLAVGGHRLYLLDDRSRKIQIFQIRIP